MFRSEQNLFFFFKSFKIVSCSICNKLAPNLCSSKCNRYIFRYWNSSMVRDRPKPVVRALCETAYVHFEQHSCRLMNWLRIEITMQLTVREVVQLNLIRPFNTAINHCTFTYEMKTKVFFFSWSAKLCYWNGWLELQIN